MFNNLIESGSHTREFKRRGSFFLFTTATYILLFVFAGVASIYAYDAHLEDQLTQEITMLSPPDLESLKTTPRNESGTPPKGPPSKQNVAEREIAMATVDNTRIPPDTVSVVPNKNLPIPPSGFYRITGRDVDPIGPGGGARPGSGGGRDLGAGLPAIEIGTPPPPPPPPVESVVPKVISKGPITGLALSLPKPPYPQIARQAGANGPVNVQVLIDETGKVVSARAVSGNPLLRAAAQQAAFLARFSPTRLGDQPVKVSGVITYNFVLQ